MLQVFESEIGMPFPGALIPCIPLQPLAEFPNDELILGSPSAVNRAYLDQGSIEDFLETAPEGYVLMGFWGHGVNSYAFYYCVADSWRRLFFRLPYGGAYMDNTELALWIRGFLSNYVEFEDTIRHSVRSLTAVDSMGYGRYKVVGQNGRIIECRESLLKRPDFIARLSPRG